MILAFGTFIGACGLTHYMEVFTLWVPDYWLSGAVKVVTAVASVATGAYLFQSSPQITDVARAADLAEDRRRQLATASRRHQRAFRALSGCSQALVRATNEQALLDAVCRIFIGVGGYRLCWIGFAEHDERMSIRPAAHAGHEDGYLSTLDLVWSDTDGGRDPHGRAIRTRKPVIVRDVTTDQTFAPWRSEVLMRGYGSLVALPLVAEGAALGVLGIYSAAADPFDEDEMSLLTGLADDLAFGIAALRGRAERDQMTAHLMLTDRMASVGTLAASVAHSEPPHQRRASHPRGAHRPERDPRRHEDRRPRPSGGRGA
jgi:putative methionine-R-sulfoxide reductase with GAF domain